MPQVRERMTKKVVTIQPGTTVVDAAKTMIKEEKGPLPIVKGDRPIAIVTTETWSRALSLRGRTPARSRWMTSRPRISSRLSPTRTWMRRDSSCPKVSWTASLSPKGDGWSESSRRPTSAATRDLFGR
jgi:hypothetical protein